MALGHWWITLMMNSFSFFLRNAIVQKQFLILKGVGHINAGDVWSLIHPGFLSMHITIHCILFRHVNLLHPYSHVFFISLSSTNRRT